MLCWVFVSVVQNAFGIDDDSHHDSAESNAPANSKLTIEFPNLLSVDQLLQSVSLWSNVTSLLAHLSFFWVVHFACRSWRQRTTSAECPWARPPRHRTRMWPIIVRLFCRESSRRWLCWPWLHEMPMPVEEPKKHTAAYQAVYLRYSRPRAYNTLG